MDKSDSAYKTIGEVAKILNLKSNKKGELPTHIIRFWETQFKQIKPKILNSNRRYYDEHLDSGPSAVNSATMSATIFSSILGTPLRGAKWSAQAPRGW